MSFAGLLDSKCNVKRKSRTTDNQGGWTSTWTTLYRRVPCCFETLTKRLEIQAYDKQAVFPHYFVYLEWRSGIKEGDRLVWDKDSTEYEIVLVENTKHMGKYMKLAVVQVGRGE